MDRALAEKLIILTERGNALLDSFTLLASKDFIVLKPEYQKIGRKVQRAFPEACSSSGMRDYDSLIRQKAAALLDEINPYFNSLVNLANWTREAVKLSNTAATFVLRAMDAGGPVTWKFFELVTILSKTMYVTEFLPDYKTMLGFFLLLITEQGQLDSYAEDKENVIAHFDQFQAPQTKMRDLLKGIHPLVAKSLFDLGKNWERVDHEPREGRLVSWKDVEVFGQPTRIANRVQETDYFRFIHRDELGHMILFCYLVIPDALAYPEDTRTGRKIGKKKTLAIGLLDRVLSKYYRIPVRGGMVIDVQEKYLDMFNRYRSPCNVRVKALRKHLSRMTPLAALELHMTRRLFVATQLKNLHFLLSDSPELCGSRFPIILSLLSLAKAELMWFIHHLDYPKMHARRANFREKFRFVREIIYYSDHVFQIVRREERTVQEYYQTDMRENEKYQIGEEELGRIFDEEGLEAWSSLLEQYRTNTENLLPARLTWLRVVVHCILRLNRPAPNCKSLFDIAEQMYLASRHIDETLREVLDVSMKDMFFFNEIHQQLFDESLKDRPHYCMSFVRLWDQFRECAHPIDMDRKQEIGFGSTIPAENMLKKLTEKVVSFVQQAMDVDRGLGVLFRRLQHPVTQEVMRPGAESHFDTTFGNEIEYLRKREVVLFRTLREFAQSNEIQVYDTVFYPCEYVREAVELFANQYVEQLIVFDSHGARSEAGKVLLQPTDIRKAIGRLVTMLQILEQYFDINPREIVLTAMVTNFVPVDPANDRVVSSLANFYCETLIRRTQELGVLYDPIRRTFINTQRTDRVLDIKFEHYTDRNEMLALVDILGPWGMDCIDKKLTGAVHAITDMLKKDLIDKFDEAFGDFRAAAVEFKDVFRFLTDKQLEFPDMERFFEYCVDLGALLQFRMNLQDATTSSMRAAAPQIFSLLRDVHSQVTEPMKKARSYKRIAQLGRDCGVYLNDGVLREKLLELSNSKCWENLPAAFAAMLLCPCWGTEMYHPTMEGWANNAHLIITCFQQLLPALFPPRKLQEMGKRFCELAGIILLLLRRGGKPFERQTENTTIFVDKLVSTCSFVRKSDLENVAPHVLTRHAYFRFFASGAE